MNKATVMIIEDDWDSRALCGECLRQENLDVVESENGEEALKYLTSHQAPALIFMDLSLPKLSGEEFLKKMRDIPHLEKVPVVLMSGWDELKRRAEVIGAQGYLKKPFNIDDLINVAKQYSASAH